MWMVSLQSGALGGRGGAAAGQAAQPLTGVHLRCPNLIRWAALAWCHNLLLEALGYLDQRSALLVLPSSPARTGAA